MAPRRMTAGLSVVVTGVIYNFAGELGYWDGDQGFGMAPLHRLSERGPLQHGATDTGARLDPRSVTIGVMLPATDEATLEDKRDLLLDLFRPRDTPVALRLYRANGQIRHLDAHTTGGLEFGSAQISRDYGGHIVLKTSIDLVAPDPVWYDPAELAVSFGVAAGAGGMFVPTMVPTFIGASTVDQTTQVPYDGSWLSNPIITIQGPITDPVVQNLTTGEKLSFVGFSLASGMTYTIDTRYGYKTVTDTSGGNRISELSTDSDLTGFHLEPDASGNINTLRVTGSAANSATQVFVRFRRNFIGV